MRVLVACEESQAVTLELRKLGHEAYSCDVLPCSGGHPEWHVQADALEVAKMSWDMVLAFPPCTHLAVSGARWFPEKVRDGRQQRAIGFFLAFTALDHVPRVAIENPVGIMSRLYRKPDQIIQPWMFDEGDLPLAQRPPQTGTHRPFEGRGTRTSRARDAARSRARATA